MQSNTITNNFNYQEMLSAIDKIQQWPSTKVKKIKVSFDFYKKMKDNIFIENKNNELYDGFWGVPLEIVDDLEKKYKFVYEEVKNAKRFS